jgi:hypothetical protein
MRMGWKGGRGNPKCEDTRIWVRDSSMPTADEQIQRAIPRHCAWAREALEVELGWLYSHRHTGVLDSTVVASPCSRAPTIPKSCRGRPGVCRQHRPCPPLRSHSWATAPAGSAPLIPDAGCRMDLPGPTTSVGTRTEYSVGPWDYSTCATRHLMAWGARTTVEKYSDRKLYMSCIM